MKRVLLCGAVLLLFSADALAIDGGPSSATQTQTETWLQLQSKGAAASPIPQTSTPAERDLSLQRWLDTYKHEIPPFFERDAGGSFSTGK